MVVRLRITLEQSDFSGLLKLVLSELRTPESQLLFILRKELNLHNQPVEEDDSSRVKENSVFKEVSKWEGTNNMSCHKIFRISNWKMTGLVTTDLVTIIPIIHIVRWLMTKLAAETASRKNLQANHHSKGRLTYD